jgi:hypothetical protein
MEGRVTAGTGKIECQNDEDVRKLVSELDVSFIGISTRFAWSPCPPGGSPEPGALHPDVFSQPAKPLFLSRLPVRKGVYSTHAIRGYVYAESQ